MRRRLRRWLFWRIDRVEDWLLDRDWAPDWLFNGQQAACWVLRVHEPIPDQCNIPEHDYCAFCRAPTPRMASG